MKNQRYKISGAVRVKKGERLVLSPVEVTVVSNFPIVAGADIRPQGRREKITVTAVEGLKGGVQVGDLVVWRAAGKGAK